MSSGDFLTEETFLQFNNNKRITKDLRIKANEFLQAKRYANNIIEIINTLEDCYTSGESVIPSILTIEYIFTELFKRKEMFIDIQPLKPKENTVEIQYREWLQERYDVAFMKLVNCFTLKKVNESTQAFDTCIKLLNVEGYYKNQYMNKNANVIDDDDNNFPLIKLKLILIKLLSNDISMENLITRLNSFSCYIDLVYYIWKCLIRLTPKGLTPNNTFVLNYLLLIDKLTNINLEKRLYFIQYNNNDNNMTTKYDSHTIKKLLNKCWNCIILWNYNSVTHRQLLIVLIEKILIHLDKPILLTDFLMDSLDVGGPISLLALQGIFILIQEHNLNYPNIYDKLYSMFEPEIFHTKYKARLFYLSDIFLSSNHLPESLVAAFVKRMARLTLVAPPQDIVIILYFIGNMILRHPGLKRLICRQGDNVEVTYDPYIMDESNPIKANAMDSSLWEISTLEYHILPNISTAAKFISNPLPKHEWDLTKVLDIDENDLFDKELLKQVKNGYQLSYNRINSMFLSKNDQFIEYWKLF